jgi:hypothetical protein
VVAVAVLASLARINPIYAIVLGIIGGALLGAFIAFSRYAANGFGFFRTMLGGACGAFFSTMAVLITAFAFSFITAFATRSSPFVEQQYVTGVEAFLLVMIGYGGGSLVAGACVGIVAWLTLRFCQFDV